MLEYRSANAWVFNALDLRLHFVLANTKQYFDTITIIFFLNQVYKIIKILQKIMELKYIVLVYSVKAEIKWHWLPWLTLS